MEMRSTITGIQSLQDQAPEGIDCSANIDGASSMSPGTAQYGFNDNGRGFGIKIWPEGAL